MGLFSSPRIVLQNRPLFIKYRAILIGVYGVYFLTFTDRFKTVVYK